MSICDFIGTTIRSILYSAVGVFAIGMQAFARTIREKTEQRDARQAEIADLEEKITAAHTALMEGME